MNHGNNFIKTVTYPPRPTATTTTVPPSPRPTATTTVPPSPRPTKLIFNPSFKQRLLEKIKK